MKFTHDFKKFPELTNSQMGFFYFDSPHKQITEDFFGKVVKVTDGDTIRVKADFRDFDFPIRFNNILAPELNEEGGRESKSWLENQIMDEEVEIKVKPNLRVGKWGRLLGSVWHNGFDIGELSKQNGHSLNLTEEQDKIKDLILKQEFIL